MRKFHVQLENGPPEIALSFKNDMANAHELMNSLGLIVVAQVP